MFGHFLTMALMSTLEVNSTALFEQRRKVATKKSSTCYSKVVLTRRALLRA